uniref:SMC hinge domain-containing protein n=1 Tax=Lactuca sativa TaxID=4236 RepID=A0A9R1VYY4_LACSA|nr:hypothetical protein LSAT_V11C300156100 [Lactuca sativa]
MGARSFRPADDDDDSDDDFSDDEDLQSPIDEVDTFVFFMDTATGLVLKKIIVNLEYRLSQTLDFRYQALANGVAQHADQEEIRHPEREAGEGRHCISCLLIHVDEERNVIYEELVRKYNAYVEEEEEVKKLDNSFKDLTREVQGLTREKQKIEKQRTTAVKKTKRIMKKEKQLSVLYQKQGRPIQFHSKAAHEEWLQKDIDKYNKVLSSNEKQGTESEITAEIECLKSEVVKAEKALDHDIRRGISTVRRTCKEYNITGVLFHVVVENDDILTHVIRHLNEEKGGRVTFIPLNCVKAPHGTYPQTFDVIPLLKKLKYSPNYEHEFSQIYRDLDVATRVARTDCLDCITATLLWQSRELMSTYILRRCRKPVVSSPCKFLDL